MRALLLPLLILVLSVAHAEEKPDKTWFLFVNGGNTETSNYATHEEWIKAFYYGFFKERGLILNAGGEKTKVAPRGTPGPFERDASGWLELAESKLPFKTFPATKEALRFQMLRLASSNPKRATLIYDDHGGPDGPRLWLKDGVTAQELMDWQRPLPPEMMVRSVHLHCYAGAAIVDPKRTVPTSNEQWDGYLNKHYRAKSCALALSAHDELGEYESWGKNWEEGYWKKLFDEIPNPSIDDWKKKIAADNTREIVPVTTSDYLIDDLFTFFCRTMKGSASRKKIPIWAGGHQPNAPIIVDGGQSNEERCKELNEDKALQEAVDAQVKALKIEQATRDYNTELAYRFLEKKDPELVRYYLHVQGEVEKVKAEFLPKRDSAGILSPADQRAFQEKMRELFTPTYNTALARVQNIESGQKYWKEFVDYQESEEIRKEMESEAFKKKYPLYTEFSKDPANAKADIPTTLYSNAFTNMRAKQRARKTLEVANREKKRLFVRSLVGREGFEKLAGFLQEIEKCEASPLRD